MSEIETITETATERTARLALTDIGEGRAKTLGLAHPHVDDETFRRIGDALRVNRDGPTITLPAHRFEGLSRGKGWARKGKGDSAEWGERTEKGYRVGPGRWTVGGSDGFSRKGEDTWTVEHITIDGKVWTIAR